VTARAYPADQGAAALTLFTRWFGGHFARSTAIGESSDDEGVVQATISVGRRWDVQVTLLNTLLPEATLAYESERAAIEKRMDLEGHSLALWPPRGAPLPAGEPGLSQLAAALNQAQAIPDGRLEIRRPVNLYLRRTSNTGSVVSILGGLSAHWAQFTNRVPGSFQMNALELFRMPASEDEREELAERIVLAAGQPDVDDSVAVSAVDAWSGNDLGDGPSCVIGSPLREGDEQSATLRRELRKMLKRAGPPTDKAAAARALVVLGASTYAEEEKLSWALRGMDPTLYSGYDLIAVIADGTVKRLLEPARQTLPWDAPLG
jgi:hypothetical protein